MTHVFDVARVRDVPTTGQDAVLLSARVDLDLATREAARAEMLDSLAGPVGALVLDLGRAFVGAVVVRDLVAFTERATRTGRPVAVAGAPLWLVGLAARLDVPPLHFTDTVDGAVRALRAAVTAADRTPAPVADSAGPPHVRTG